jgi:hypothetical protein
MTTARISRNSLCPCGSGKKYKKCCLLSGASTPRFRWPLTTDSAALRPRQRTSFPRTMNRSSASGKKWNEVLFDAPLSDGGHLHAVLLYSDAGLNTGLIRKGEIVALDLPEVGFRGPATVVAIQRVSTTGDVEAEVVRVVRFRDDDDLGKPLCGQWKLPRDFVERWAKRRRTIVMRMDFPDGRWCDIRLLRTVKWIGEHSVRMGGTVFLDLTDVGVRGWANVMEIRPCPLTEELGAGEMVTGTFRYSLGRIGELVLESEQKPIGVTPSHLFWSEDRQTWVQVRQLRRGEAVKTLKTFGGTKFGIPFPVMLRSSFGTLGARCVAMVLAAIIGMLYVMIRGSVSLCQTSQSVCSFLGLSLERRTTSTKVPSGSTGPCRWDRTFNSTSFCPSVRGAGSSSPGSRRCGG